MRRLTLLALLTGLLIPLVQNPRIALARNAASIFGNGNFASCSPRSSIQCQPVWATNADRTSKANTNPHIAPKPGFRKKHPIPAPKHAPTHPRYKGRIAAELNRLNSCRRCKLQRCLHDNSMPSATAQVQQANLMGNGQNVSLNAQWSGVRRLTNFSFYEPYFLDSRFQFSLSLSFSGTRWRRFDVAYSKTLSGACSSEPSSTLLSTR